MTGPDWHDPFAEDPEAIERERRRAEREARRRGTQESLGEKVSEAQAPAPADDASPAVGTPPAQAPPTSERTAVQPATAEPPAAEAPPVRPPSRRGGPPSREGLLARRILGIVILVTFCAAVVIVVLALIDEITGSDELAEPLTAAKTSEITIPEGLDRHQIADLAKEEGLKGDYEQASKSFKGFDPAKYGAEAPPNLEGFLFPALYELPKKPTAKDLISRQLDAFKANIREVDLSYAESKNLNVYDVLKIASMIEREIAVPEERELAAAVIYNRLSAGDTLGIDATIRYYLQNYDEQLTESELADPHAYNTRVNPGLPPTPIGNPGLASIEAAANPAKTDAYYFVIKPGTCNEHVFVATEEEFAQAEADYQAALQAEGGSPTDC